jgi:Flp pilus assembly pilin Flp
MKLGKLLQRFLSEERGSETVEYGVMAAILAALIAVAVLLMSPGLKTGFTNMGKAVSTPPSP